MPNSSNIPRGRWADFRYLTSHEVLQRADMSLVHLIDDLNSYAENEDVLFDGPQQAAFKFKCKDIVDSIGRLSQKLQGAVYYARQNSRKY